MTNQEFADILNQWKSRVQVSGITLPNGKPLPDKFWPLFLGYSESAYKKFKTQGEDKRPIKAYTEKHIRLIDLLEHEQFLNQVQAVIPDFVAQFPQFDANNDK